jgi:hypothetical protein
MTPCLSPSLRIAALGVATLAILAADRAAAADESPVDSGVKSCPGSPVPWQPGGDPAASAPAPAPPRQLLPGTVRVTPGEAVTGHLVGQVIVDEPVPFSFLGQGSVPVSGTLVKKVVDATDGTCDFYYTVVVAPTSALAIDGLVIGQFLHPAQGLYGAWRDDVLPQGIPPDHVQRSAGAGATITFRIAAGVQPGQTSRPLLLDGAVGSTKDTGTVRLRAADGTLSGPIPAWVPNWP